MLRWIGAITAGIVIIIGLPIAAIAVTKATAPEPWNPEATVAAQSEGATAEEIEVTAQDTDGQATTSQVAPQTQQRLRIHSETGPPEGFEPIQQRLHQQEQMATNGDGRSDDAPGRRGPPADRGGQNGRDHSGRGRMKGQGGQQGMAGRGGQQGMAGRGGPHGAEGVAGACTHDGPGTGTCPNATNS